MTSKTIALRVVGRNTRASSIAPICKCCCSSAASRQFNQRPFAAARRLYSSPLSSPISSPGDKGSEKAKEDKVPKESKVESTPNKKQRSISDLDAEHLAKVHEAVGGGDMTNIEFENGVADRGMRRNVRENMFRII